MVAETLFITMFSSIMFGNFKVSPIVLLPIMFLPTQVTFSAGVLLIPLVIIFSPILLVPEPTHL